MGAIRNLKTLPEMVKESNAEIFIETGAGYGTGIFTVLPFRFNNILSVEIDSNQTDLLNLFFRFDTRVRVFNSTSKIFLESILPQIPKTSRIFFFLDAHYPQADFGIKDFDSEKDENIRMPLFDELSIIKRIRIDNGSKDTILVDDISLYDDSDRVYEDDHKKKIIAHKLIPKNHFGHLNKFIDMLSNTHDSKVLTQEQGYLIFNPK